ncbi:MAG: hypothetical protein WAV98_03930 [Minisyncoccia bacterium]
MNDYIISWTAPEYDHHEHTADWYWAVGIVSVSLAIAFIIVGNALLSIVILIGMSTLLYYSRHQPKNTEYEFSKEGIRAGKTLYPWKTLESFWILEGHVTNGKECAPRVLLTSKKTLMPHIVILLNEFVIDEVHQSLSHMLHEMPQTEPIHDRLMRVIGF